jgi:hypothetical protein
VRWKWTCLNRVPLNREHSYAEGCEHMCATKEYSAGITLELQVIHYRPHTLVARN